MKPSKSKIMLLIPGILSILAAGCSSASIETSTEEVTLNTSAFPEEDRIAPCKPSSPDTFPVPALAERKPITSLTPETLAHAKDADLQKEYESAVAAGNAWKTDAICLRILASVVRAEMDNYLRKEWIPLKKEWIEEGIAEYNPNVCNFQRLKGDRWKAITMGNDELKSLGGQYQARVMTQETIRDLFKRNNIPYESRFAVPLFVQLDFELVGLERRLRAKEETRP